MSAPSFWQRFRSTPHPVAWRERCYGVGGALLGLFVCEWISRYFLQGINPWFLAPMGASAVLLFAAPTTPMAQPWPMLGGNLVSALVGVACAKWLGHSGAIAALAAASAIAVMFALRCLHPPGGAMAITAVAGGAGIEAQGWGFVSGPVLANVLSLIVIALFFNNLLQRRYPHRPVAHANQHRTDDRLPSERLGFSHADLDAVLATRGEVLDISKDDLEEILIAAEQRAHRRRFGDVRCADIMSRDVVFVTTDAPAREAWQKLAHHRVKALPVVDDKGVLAGIVVMHDFFINHDNQPWLNPPWLEAERRIDSLMTEQVATAYPEQPIVELVKQFSDSGRHHLPVVNERREVIGILTQSDLVAALFSTSLRS